VVRWTPLAVAILAFQGAIVAFASYLGWFWLLTKYFAARLSVLSFMTPLFGVLFGAALLGERITPAFLAAALLVAGGIVLVNLSGSVKR
jgi:drug/metabolite transporter (DMT)-like permease